MSSATRFGLLVVALALAVPFFRPRIKRSSDAAPSGGNPYDILGVASDADKPTITKAYRALAKRWHPDRHTGDKAVADAAFAAISHAYDVLLDPEKREIFDRLGENGLERFRDGDPSVNKDWLPPDEILRRIHNDGDEAWLEYLVTSSFSNLATLWTMWEGLASSLFTAALPSVVIIATDASGAALVSGGRTDSAVTFKFSLSGKSFDFREDAITHNCGRSRFLGMKTTFYLQCEHEPGAELAVTVAANVFTVTGRQGTNTASEPFTLTMV